MKRFSLFLALTLAVSIPVLAQNTIEAPAGWKTQTRNGGATTFTPPDLRAGETYNVTTYASARLGGKSLEAYLRAFAGPVGTQPGQLAAPLKISAPSPQAATAIGAYSGPDGKLLGVMFVGFAFDGANVTVTRTLFFDENLIERYLEGQKTLMSATLKGTAKQGGNAAPNAPAGLPEGMTTGGAMVPGVYVGTQFKSGSFGSRSSLGLRVYIYPNGEYRICDQNDQDFDLSGPVVGKIQYNRARGLLGIKEFFALSNDGFNAGKTYCYYGRNAEGKPVIFGRSSVGSMTSNGYTTLVWQGPPTGRAAQSVVDGPARRPKAKRDAIQTRVAPGRGVPASQVAAIVKHFSSTFVMMPQVYMGETFGGYAPGININNVTDDTYLLLRDGTIHRGLEVAPDQFDARASRRKEPENWGLWKQEGRKIQMSFAGKAYEDVPGQRVLPGTPQTRLGGRYTFEGGSISFSPAGRFQRSTAPKSDPSAKFTLTKAQKTGGDLAGTYSLSGYAMTLRYNSGKVERMLFFSEDPRHESVWFEGGWIGLDKRR